MPRASKGARNQAAALLRLALAAACIGGTLSTRTCPHSCQETPGPLDQAARKEEVFGGSSRCFREGGGVHACLKVKCSTDLLGYRIILSDGAQAVCVAAEAYVVFGGLWQGGVICDAPAQVCAPDGSVAPNPEEQRRAEVSRTLMQLHGQQAAVELMAAYDTGRFDPHTPEERGLPAEYLVQRVGTGCQLGSWMQGLPNEDMGALGFVAMRNVSTQKLLGAVRDTGCVAAVEQNMVMQASASQVPWGIDSLDGTLDGQYRRFYGGKGVDVFVVDTGVDANHEELRGKVADGVDFTGSNPKSTQDRQGHGTHCAGTIAGNTVGVAPEASIVPMKVLGDDGSGNGAWVIQAFDWILTERRKRQANGGRPMVVSASLGGARSGSINTAVNKLVEAGVTVVVAAGNENQDASRSSPSSEPSAITVGAVDKANAAASFSNFGQLLDIWGPGVDIVSAKVGGGLTSLSGTSMATPHVSGVVALLLELHPAWSPSDVLAELQRDCNLDQGQLKRSTGKILRTYASTGGTCDLASSTATAPDAPAGRSSSSHVVAGVVIAVVLAVLAAATALLCWCYRDRLRKAFPTYGGDKAAQGTELRSTGPPPQRVPAAAATPVPVAPPAAGAAKSIWRTQAPPPPPPATITRTEALTGPEWEALQRNKASLAKQVQECHELLMSRKRFENDCEQVFTALRQEVRMVSREQGALDEVPPPARVEVWYFLTQMAEERRLYRSQVPEVAALLNACPGWRASFAAGGPELNRRWQAANV